MTTTKTRTPWRRAACVLAIAAALGACGGGGDSVAPTPEPTPVPTPMPEPTPTPGAGTPVAPTGLAVAYDVKSYQFSWTPVVDADAYELWEDPDGTGPQSEVRLARSASGFSSSYVHSLAPQLLHERLNASYRIRACNSSGCGDFSAAIVPDLTRAIGYFKASNTQSDDLFGSSIALSRDGTTLAIGAMYEGSNARGIDGDQANNAAPRSGAVYVFSRSDGRDGHWSQQAYVKASNTDAGDGFGFSVALSGNGNTLVVGAPGESSNATGIGGDQANNSAPVAGAVYVFTRTDARWSQQAYVKASNTDGGDRFGYSVTLSGNGNTMAVGAVGESSSATRYDGNQHDNSLAEAGAAYVFTRTAGAWSQFAYLKAANSDAHDQFGFSLALADDGKSLAVGAPLESSRTTGVNNVAADNSAPMAGAAYVFWRVTNAAGDIVWAQNAYVKASNTDAGDQFGSSVALSGDGTTLAVGAAMEDSKATGINGNQGDNSKGGSGAVYVFAYAADIRFWRQQAYVKASNTGMDSGFGWSISLSGSGDMLAVGAPGERSNATGIDGDQGDGPVANVGAGYLYAWRDGTWTQQAYVKPSNLSQFFGIAIALSNIGRTLAVSASYEYSRATGINGDQADVSAPNAGAVYLY